MTPHESGTLAHGTRILVLCKRQYTGRDLIDDQYGRLFEIPEALARSGHHVRGIAASYRYRPSPGVISPAGVDWRSFNAIPFGAWHVARLRPQTNNWSPDIVWASSDALHCVAGHRLARALGVPVVLDLYDNYDHFGLTSLPGLRSAYHRACAAADALTVVSHCLAEHVADTFAPTPPATIVVNGVRSDLFQRRNQAEARDQLGLDRNARIIGCAGALDAGRGIEDLFLAFRHLADQDPNLLLAIAGPRDGTPARHPHPRIVDFGELPWQQVPVLLNALDVAVVCNRDSTFGRFCFPLKLHEALACGVPVVAAAVGDVRNVLQNIPASLYRPGDHMQLANLLAARINTPIDTPPHIVPSWSDLAAEVERTLARAIAARQ